MTISLKKTNTWENTPVERHYNVVMTQPDTPGQEYDRLFLHLLSCDCHTCDYFLIIITSVFFPFPESGEDRCTDSVVFSISEIFSCFIINVGI